MSDSDLDNTACCNRSGRGLLVEQLYGLRVVFKSYIFIQP
jgi:hypothetical protein